MAERPRRATGLATAAFRATDGVTALLVIAMTVIIMSRVLNRWLSLGITGQGEAAQILLMWVVYLNIGAAASRDTDIKSDYLFNRIPDRFQPSAEAAILVNNVAVTTFIVVSTLLVIDVSVGRTTTSLGAPVVVLYVPLLVGAGLLWVVYARGLVTRLRELTGRSPGESSG